METRAFLAKIHGKVEHPHDQYREATKEAAICPLKIVRSELWRKENVALGRCKGWLLKLINAMQIVVEETDGIKEVLWRAACNNWFEYPTGLRIHYWCFPKCYRSKARDGVGLSCGIYLEGVMSGDRMVSYISMEKSALEQHPGLIDYVKLWDENCLGRIKFLEPEDWFNRGHRIVGGTKDAN
jgi:hypothetical protein